MSDRDAVSRWERIKSVFSEALELQPAERCAFLDRELSDEPELRGEVESLLGQHEQSDDFMSEPTLRSEAGRTTGAVADEVLERLGPYEILGLIGAGGMGRVYLAHDDRLRRRVALKVLPPGLSNHPERRQRFLREARAAAGLSHPHIAAVHDVGQADGRDYIASEYVSGQPLSERLSDGPLDVPELLALAVPLAEALAHAHRHGVIHRDVKAANVVLDEAGAPKLVDFGAAKIVATDGAGGVGTAGGEPTAITLGGGILGTPGAMSPEQALSQALDHRTDVFSFGSLLYEMACGEAPFAAGTTVRTIDAVIHGDPVPLHERRPGLPAGLIAIIDRALAKDPERRYPDMEAMAVELRALAEDVDAGVAAPYRPPWRGVARRPGILVVSLILAAVVWWGFGGDGGDGAVTPPHVATTPHAVAVVLFENTVRPDDADHLGAMLARLLTHELSATPDLPVVSQQRLHDVSRQLGGDGRIARSTATPVARQAGLETMIVGAVSPLGDGLLATAELVEVRTGRTLGAVEARGTDEQDVFAMARSLARQVRAMLQAGDVTPAERQALDRQLTTSVDAYRAYVRGQKALEHNDIDAAIEAFGEAARIDPSFALAHFRQAMALIWKGRGDETHRALERALAFRDRLPEEMRTFAEALGPYLFNDRMTEGLPHLLAILESDPYQRDALYELGEVATHSAVCNDAARAAGAYERLLEVAPGFTLVYEHLINAYLRLGRNDRAHEQLETWEPIAPDVVAGLEAELALWEGRFDDAAAARGVDDLELALLRGDGYDWPVAVEPLLSASVDEIIAGLGDVEGSYLVLELDLRSDALAYLGRFAAAAELYRRAATVDEPVSPAGYVTNTRNASRHRLAFLLALRGDLPGARRLVDEALAVQPESGRCLYVALLIAAQQQDAAAVQALRARLGALAEAAASPTAELYAAAAAAEHALLEGRAAEARDGYAGLVASGRLMEDWYVFSDSFGPYVRDGMARACAAAGDTEGAAAALDGLLDSGYERLRHPVIWTRALATAGLLDLDAGREARGRERLQRFLAAWGDADDVALVVAVKQRLAD